MNCPVRTLISNLVIIRIMKILAYQTHSQGICSVEAITQHNTRITQAIKNTVKNNPVDLIVLPELSSIEYSTVAFERLNELAEPLLGKTFRSMSELAAVTQSHVVYGIPRMEGKEVFISQVVIDRKGKYLTHYDKKHIAQFGDSTEQPYFTQGKNLGLFSISNIKLAIIICYDFRFAHYVRSIVKAHDIDVILHPCAFAKDGTYASWHPFVITRALENQVYFLSLNRAGSDWGQSIFCPPWVDKEVSPTVFNHDETLEFFEISTTAIANSRATYPFRKDELENYD